MEDNIAGLGGSWSVNQNRDVIQGRQRHSLRDSINKAARATEAATAFHVQVKQAAELVDEKPVETAPIIEAARILTQALDDTHAKYLAAEIAGLNAAMNALGQSISQVEQTVNLERMAARIEQMLLDDEEAILVLLLAGP